MNTKHHLHLTPEKILRIVSDALLINISLLIALAIRYFYQMEYETKVVGAASDLLLTKYKHVYLNSAWLLTSIALVVFYLSGFYTYGRAYSSRYKVLIVTQAVSLSYLLCGFVTYFFGLDLPLPRGAWALAWIISTATLVAARVWSLLWRRLTFADNQLHNAPQKKDASIGKVLVIGGAGYIGSALLPKLLDKGYKVRLLDLMLYGTDPIKEIISHPHLEIIRDDFRHVDTVVEAMHGRGDSSGRYRRRSGVRGGYGANDSGQLDGDPHDCRGCARQRRQTLRLRQHLFRLWSER